MKKILISSLVMLSFSAFASQKSTEPKVNFDGVKVGITKTCLSADGQKLVTLSPVKLYAQVERAGKSVSTYIGSSVLETSVDYVAKGKCLRRGVKNICTQYAPSSVKSYELTGSFKVSHYRTVAGKAKVITSTEVVDYAVNDCI